MTDPAVGLAVLGREPDAIGPPLAVGTHEDVARCRRELVARGWVEHASQLAHFADGHGERLDLLAIPPGELDDFADLVRGQVPLARELQLRARAAPASGPGVLDVYRYALHRRLVGSGDAWLRAHAEAAPDDRMRISSLEWAYDSGLPWGGWPGATVALCGLDGTGKSTQGHLLAAALHDVGIDAAVEWARVGFSPRLDRLASPVKRFLREAPKHPPEGADSSPTEGNAPTPSSGARRISARPPVVDAGWSLLVAGTDAAEERVRQARYTAAGRVLLRDRYLLDSLVHVVDRYGDHQTRLARMAMRRFTPQATVAFLLEIPAEVAQARKPGEWSTADLRRHAHAYDDLADRLGVLRVDARGEAEEVGAGIAKHVWQALP